MTFSDNGKSFTITLSFEEAETFFTLLDNHVDFKKTEDFADIDEATMCDEMVDAVAEYING